MKKRILSYRKKIDSVLSGGECDWALIREEHLVQISFFQHERLIHLIVTALFALAEVIAIALFLFTESRAVCIFCAAVFVLLIPYIFHYYTLENEVHRLYAQYDLLREKCAKCSAVVNSTVKP